MDFTELAKKIVEYVKKRANRGKVPTVNAILLKFGLYRAQLYEMFPGGLGEICQRAEVPLPQERLRTSEDANRARKHPEIPLGGMILPPERVDALRGMGHLEGTSDLLSVFDEIVKRDTKLRLAGINLENWKTIMSQADNWRKMVRLLTSRQKDNEDLVVTSQRLITERDQYSLAVQTSKQETESLKAKLQAKDSEIEAAKHEVASSKDREIEAIRAENQTKNSELERQQIETDRLRAEINERDTLESEFNQAKQKHGRRLTHRLKQAEEYDQLKEQIQQEQEKKTQIETECRKLEKTTYEWKDIGERLITEINNLYAKKTDALEKATRENPDFMARILFRTASPEQLRSIVNKFKLDPIQRLSLAIDLNIRQKMGLI